MSLAPGRTDWRWAKAADVAEYTDTQAIYHLRSADQQTIDAYRFKRGIDRGERFDGTAIAAAYELFINRFEERLYVEGHLLAGSANEQIAPRVPCGPDDVQAYHDVFFDIRERRDAPAWIIGQLFQGGLYGPMNLRDRSGVAHRIAWMAGPEIFEAYATGKSNPQIMDVLKDRIRDMLAKQSLINAMCLSGKGDLDVEVLRIFIDDTNKNIADTVKTAAGSKEANEVILDFLRQVPLIVADPTDPRNLTLDAREPRASHYLAKPPEVKDAVATDVR